MKKVFAISGGIVITLALSAALVFGSSQFRRTDGAMATNSIPIDSTSVQFASDTKQPNYGKIVNLAMTDTQSNINNLTSVNNVQAAGNSPSPTDATQLMDDILSQSGSGNTAAVATTTMDADSGFQLITANVGWFSYPQITVEANKPVRINFTVTAEDLNACNNEIFMSEWNIKKKLTVGDNFVEFTPTQTGTFTYTCWMDMIRSSITVVADTAQQPTTPMQTEAPVSAQTEVPTPAQTEIPANNIENTLETVTASAVDGIGTIEATVGAFAYPQITVEVNKPVRINFKVAQSDLNSCNNEIIISEWNIRKTLSVGDNFVEFTPTRTGTFTYSCWMNMISSNITVVEQGSGTVGALPPSDSANTGMGCCMTGGGCGMMGGGW